MKQRHPGRSGEFYNSNDLHARQSETIDGLAFSSMASETHQTGA